MRAAHLLIEMMIARFDGGAHQPQNEETTMLNSETPNAIGSNERVERTRSSNAKPVC